jgi:hypothetical protein
VKGILQSYLREANGEEPAPKTPRGAQQDTHSSIERSTKRSGTVESELVLDSPKKKKTGKAGKKIEPFDVEIGNLVPAVFFKPNLKDFRRNVDAKIKQVMHLDY